MPEIIRNPADKRLSEFKTKFKDNNSLLMRYYDDVKEEVEKLDPKVRKKYERTLIWIDKRLKLRHRFDPLIERAISKMIGKPL